MIRRAFLASAASAAFAPALVGCRGCHGDHPFVPYSIGSASASAEAPAASATGAALAAVDAGGATFAGEAATAAPPGLSRWPVAGVTLQAPDGRVFVAALVRDFDGDGALDALALVRPPDGNDPGDVAFYRGAAGRAELLADPTLLSPPADLSREASCTPIDRLVLVGKHAALAELGAACPLHATAAPVRWVAIVSAGASARVRLAATIADPAGAPALTVDAETADRDHDGIDDIAWRVTLEGGGAPLEPGPRVSATLAWLDRSAGLSRDAAATESSFASLASLATSRASRAKEAPAVPVLVTQVRALWRATCVDGRSPRLLGVAGTGAITCGGERALYDAGLAEVRAYQTMDDPLRAALALDRADRAAPARVATRIAEVQAAIVKLAPVVSASAVRAVAAVPVAARGREPSWGALAFETGGKLLVRTKAGTVRVDPDLGAEDAAGGGDWAPAVMSPDGSLRWIEAYDPCDGLPLRATFSAGDDVRDVALPVAPPLDGRCQGSRGAPARVTPVGWGPSGLEAFVEGEPILLTSDFARATPLAAFLDQAARPGGPLSPDGKTLVVPTGTGLIVRTDARTRIYRAPELDGTYADLRDCAVSDGGTHVACVRSGRAWVGSWASP